MVRQPDTPSVTTGFEASGRQGQDRLAQALELGIILVLVVSPMLFGAVHAGGRLALEITAFGLGLAWMARALRRPAPLPSRWVVAGMAGLLSLGLVQLLPLDVAAVRLLSPTVATINAATTPPPEVREAEQHLTGIDTASLEPSLTLSVDPSATASALRTGTALGILLLVAVTVAATRGARRLVFGLLISSAFQGLYGLLVLVSGHDRIWHLSKAHYLEAATGTFVNKNHFACYLAMSLACGIALVIDDHRKTRRHSSQRRLVWFLGAENSRNLLLLVFLLLGAAGLLVSFSRAGITLGLLGLVFTMAVAGRFQGLSYRLVIVLLIVVVAAVPLLQVGTDRLVARYMNSADDFTSAGQRTTVWGDTLRIVEAFPVFGSGFGTFAAVYPLYRSSEVRFFFKHAHNDLLQALAEGGIIGLGFLIMLMLPILSTIIRGLSGNKGVIGVGMAAAVTVFLLHSLVDFNLHIPANAATAAVLAGALLGLPWTVRD